MSNFASAIPAAQTDGLLYANNAVVPAAEGDLYNAGRNNEPPIAVVYGAAVVAAIEFAAQGAISSQTTYVVLQMDLGDGHWFDVAWCTWTGVAGTADFLLSAGVGGANAFQQTRVKGTAPATALGSNQAPLAGRFRFVGKATVNPTSSSSSSSSSGGPGTPAQVTVTIRFKDLGLR